MREYKNKKILITGNTGFKGTWLTLTLKLLGANIVGYSDKRPKKKSVISTPWLKENINQYYGKVENFSFQLTIAAFKSAKLTVCTISVSIGVLYRRVSNYLPLKKKIKHQYITKIKCS